MRPVTWTSRSSPRTWAIPSVCTYHRGHLLARHPPPRTTPPPCVEASAACEPRGGDGAANCLRRGHGAARENRVSAGVAASLPAGIQTLSVLEATTPLTHLFMLASAADVVISQKATSGQRGPTSTSSSLYVKPSGSAESCPMVCGPLVIRQSDDANCYRHVHFYGIGRPIRYGSRSGIPRTVICPSSQT
jgi:hypothetical protein